MRFIQGQRMAADPPQPPDAFLSYTRFDDRHGAISTFRQWLSDIVREVSGEPFDIFQDVDDIAVGERWSDKLGQILDRARFFIPIMTPNYFKSEACRGELQKFLEAEKKNRREDLIIPIYYIESPVLEDRALRESDHLAKVLSGRQRYDRRGLRHYSFGNRKVRLEIEKLARQIDRARQDREPLAPAPPAPKVSSPAESGAAPGSIPTIVVGPLSVGRVFRDIDAPWCPELVVIPPGEFMMGNEEGPQHPVSVAYRFAVGRYPVTFEEYDYFCIETFRKKPLDQGWGRGRRPVINVSWEDAKAYVEWLSVAVGEHYRLLSEAEWEYACRAGTTTRYWWSDMITPANANYGRRDGRTNEVGSYPANPFGLYDMHGNVWEWVEDCWNRSYDGAPNDGSAWTSHDRGRRVLPGGAPGATNQ